MDNNTAQNGTVQYPDLSQAGNNTTAPSYTNGLDTTQSTQVADDKILQDLASQISAMNNSTAQVNPPVTPTPPDPAQVPAPEPVVQAPQPTSTPEPVVHVQEPAPQPVVTEEKAKAAAQELIEKVENVTQQSAPPPPQVDLSNIQAAAPIIKDDPAPLKGVVPNELQDIIPGEKIPKALKRAPKENSLAEPIDEIDEVPAIVEKGSSTKRIDEMLRYAIQNNASDLHITAGYPPIVRIDGELKEISESILTSQDTEDLILPILSDEKKELLEVNKEIDLAYFHDGEFPGRFRINVFHAMKSMTAAFRLIPARIRTIDELMLPQIYHQFSQLKQGLILVTGPTGHGKSTTLAGILEEVNSTRFCHIVTIEDPIEYVFEGKKSLIDQREMNDDTHSWSIALRSALRQDPDVILVGEMRDYETIASAITLAETGHLVFATLHTNNAAQTVDRIIDVFPENQQPQIRLQLSNILEAIVAQRLIPLDKGGRRAVSEIMIANPAVRNLIREAKTHQIDNVIRTSADIGMISLEKALVGLVREGVISVQKAQEYAVFPEEVLRLLKS